MLKGLSLCVKRRRGGTIWDQPEQHQLSQSERATGSAAAAIGTVQLPRRAGKRTYVKICSLPVWITGKRLRPIPHREHVDPLVYLPSEPTSKYPAKTCVLLRLPCQLIVITLLAWETGSFSQVPPQWLRVSGRQVTLSDLFLRAPAKLLALPSLLVLEGYQVSELDGGAVHRSSIQDV